MFLSRQSAGSYSSRETYFNVSSPPFGFSDGRVAVHARSPDAVVPSTYYAPYALLLLLTSVIQLGKFRTIRRSQAYRRCCQSLFLWLHAAAVTLCSWTSLALSRIRASCKP